MISVFTPTYNRAYILPAYINLYSDRPAAALSGSL